MKPCKGSAALTAMLVVLLLCSAAASADDVCAPKRLDWMLEDEQCGDLVFADVVEIMLTCYDAHLRARAAAGLGRVRGPEVFSALYRVFEKDRSPRVREAALNALAAIMQRTALLPGREIMEAFFLVYQFDRYRPNRDRARELLERFRACPKMLAGRTYVSARYRPLVPLQVHESPDLKSAVNASLQPADVFAIVDELYANDQTTCWFAIETPSGMRGWVCGLRDGREYIGTDDVPPRPFESTVRSLTEVINPAQKLAIELRSGKQDDTFRPGDEIVFFVKADQDCYT
ncbi:MAG: HEAT repeat domain-containing protein [Deltaproteobacteria bacterium]|nr:HEAT repeat domain-containing protein [Deltaproteobacteria bacterium]